MIRRRARNFVYETRLMILVFAGLSLQGCQLDEFLASNQWTWLWAVAPLIILAVLGSAFVLTRRRRDLATWDLAESPSEPSVVPVLVRLASFAVTLLVAFAIYNFIIRSILDSTQLALNIGAWVIGTAIGAGMAFLIGLKLAEP